MTSKIFPIFIIVFLFFHSLLSEAILTSSNDKKTQQFEFLKHLMGCKKGDKLIGIHELKMYLEKFGYFNFNNLNNQPHAIDDYFDDNIELAIKTYQLNYNLYPTGSLDIKTVSKMMMPRCGVQDIINGITRMHSGMKMNHSTPNSFNSHYAFFTGNPKWPVDKSTLTYGFLPNTQADFMDPVAQAFRKWTSVSHFKFMETQDYANADLKISFQSWDHGDGYPFDGSGGTLAHAFAPTDGRLHFDASETWAVGAIQKAYDIGTLALHEIGHLLGLQHSSDSWAIMYPIFMPGSTKNLNEDDIQGIRALYNLS